MHYIQIIFNVQLNQYFTFQRKTKTASSFLQLKYNLFFFLSFFCITETIRSLCLCAFTLNLKFKKDVFIVEDA